ncbi:MAG: hypothetical protein DRJ03_02490 [Chloroflexi bacterium]|nr:MAG: hypothetical protein DRJ03_02490 [Chloroflexota bacterium]
MALLPRAANTEDNKETFDFAPIAEGEYILVIAHSEQKLVKGQAHSRLSVTCKVAEGDYRGRTLFLNFNLWHPDPNVAANGMKDFNGLCQACEVMAVEDSAELHGLQFKADVTIDETNPQYINNRVRGYRPANIMAPPAELAPPQVNQPETTPEPESVVDTPPEVQKPAGKKLPWE